MEYLRTNKGFFMYVYYRYFYFIGGESRQLRDDELQHAYSSLNHALVFDSNLHTHAPSMFTLIVRFAVVT